MIIIFMSSLVTSILIYYCLQNVINASTIDTLFVTIALVKVYWINLLKSDETVPLTIDLKDFNWKIDDTMLACMIYYVYLISCI